MENVVSVLVKFIFWYEIIVERSQPICSLQKVETQCCRSSAWENKTFFWNAICCKKHQSLEICDYSLSNFFFQLAWEPSISKLLLERCNSNIHLQSEFACRQNESVCLFYVLWIVLIAINPNIYVKFIIQCIQIPIKIGASLFLLLFKRKYEALLMIIVYISVSKLIYCFWSKFESVFENCIVLRSDAFAF